MQFVKNTGLLGLLLLLGNMIIAQDYDSFIFFGTMEVEKGKAKGTRITVYQDGVKERILRDDEEFEFKLDIGHEFIIEFAKENYISKQLLVSTRGIPKETLEHGLKRFEFKITIQPQAKDSIQQYKRPVARIAYDKEKDDMWYDTYYKLHGELKPTEDSEIENDLSEDIELSEKGNGGKGSGGGTGTGGGGLVGNGSGGGNGIRNNTGVGSGGALEPNNNGDGDGSGGRRSSNGKHAIGIGGHGKRPHNTNITESFERTEEFFEDGKKKITIVTITKDGQETVYKKVHHNWGGLYYFKGDEHISHHHYHKHTRKD